MAEDIQRIWSEGGRPDGSGICGENPKGGEGAGTWHMREPLGFPVYHRLYEGDASAGGKAGGGRGLPCGQRGCKEAKGVCGAGTGCDKTGDQA